MSAPLLAVGSNATQPASRPDRFVGTSIPDPPFQHAAWLRPVANLPPTLLDATVAFFNLGMADPRGCEYRQIKVAVGSVWDGGGEPVETHGWVLPPEGDSSERFAVCWNGLVYPTITVGAVADVKADIDALLALDHQAQNTTRPIEAFNNRTRFMTFTNEYQAVSLKTMTTLKVCLLLRLGQIRLAEKCWAQADPEADHVKDGTDDYYLVVANSWAWCVFDRAVCAHMRGDDIVSVETARILTRAAGKIEKSATARGFERQLVHGPKGDDLVEDTSPYLDFLEPLPALLADEEHRVAEHARPLPLEQIQKMADKTKRIAALIEDLAEIDERQCCQPGGIAVDASPIVAAIEKEGQDAVEPLIECLEKDKRLTRSVSFWRDFATGRNLIPVSDAAYLAIGNILQTREFGPASDVLNRGQTPDRKAILGEVKAFWAKTKGKSPAESWYETLADDKAGSSRWVEAAAKIVQPVDVEIRAGWETDPSRKPGEIPAIRGETLRGEKNPSVAELLGRRVPQVAADAPDTSRAVDRSNDAAQMAMALNRWDAASARPVLYAQMKQCRQAFAHWRQEDNSHLIAQDVAEMAAALAKSGDRGGLEEYASWVAQQTPDHNDSGIARVFRTMALYPDDPAITAAAERIFGDATSPWYCLAKSKGYRGVTGNDELVGSSLIAVPAFRKNVLANLADRSKVGTVSVSSPHGGFLVTLDTGLNLGTGAGDPNDALLPAVGTNRSVRVCDWYAYCLARLDGSPPFELFWPESKRDEVIKLTSEFVNRWAAGFAPSDLQDFLGRRTFDRLHITFPHLGRPATQADTKAGRAIFSLAGRGQAKTVLLDPFPMKAKWPAFKGSVVFSQTLDAVTNTQIYTTEYDQDGVVWQAEEVMEGGQLKRYYGFVGRHVIAKVPADQIKLIPNIPAWDPRSE